MNARHEHIHSTMPEAQSTWSRYFAQLKRRKVFQVAIGYMIVAWLIIQVADAILEPLQVPQWAETLIVVILLTGLPVAIVLAWALEVTPDGVQRTALGTFQGPVADASPESSIAVLPFADMSPEKDQDYFCEGMAEEIINALASIKGLHVASRTSSFQFKERSEDVRAIGQALNVSSVLEGSVRKAGDQLRVTAQLIKVSDGYHIWSERFDRRLEDVFAIQDEIAQCVVETLQVRLSTGEQLAIEQPSTSDVEAYDFYLRGRKFFHRLGANNLEFARQMFTQAIALDPEFALAHAGLADTCSIICLYLKLDEKNARQASESSQRALELAPELAEAHASRGLALMINGEYARAEKYFRAAIRLNPRLFEAYYYYARVSVQQGKIEEAVRWYEKASEVRPEDYQSLLLATSLLRRLGDKEKMERFTNEGQKRAMRQLEVNPDDARAAYLTAATMVNVGRTDEALRLAERGACHRSQRFRHPVQRRLSAFDHGRH